MGNGPKQRNELKSLAKLTKRIGSIYKTISNVWEWWEGKHFKFDFSIDSVVCFFLGEMTSGNPALSRVDLESSPSYRDRVRMKNRLLNHCP